MMLKVYTNFLETLLYITGLSFPLHCLFPIVIILDEYYNPSGLSKTEFSLLICNSYSFIITYIINIVAIGISYIYCKKFIDINLINKRNILILFTIILNIFVIDIVYFLFILK